MLSTEFKLWQETTTLSKVERRLQLNHYPIGEIYSRVKFYQQTILLYKEFSVMLKSTLK